MSNYGIKINNELYILTPILKIIKRNGEKVLQQYCENEKGNIWRDVPVYDIEEE